MSGVKYVRDVMQRGVITCSPDTPLVQVAALMAQGHASAVAVVNPSGELIGIVSRTDLVRAYLKPFGHLLAEQVMTTQVATIIPDIPVQAAVQIMLDRGVHQLVILHARPAPQRPVGILTMDEIVRDMAKQEDSTERREK
jgi:CBS domain-containing protein